MLNKNINIQMKVLFWITMINFIAQIPYFFQLYYRELHDLKKVINVPMILVFVLFLIGYKLLIEHNKIGYWLMIIFLSMEFLFYFSNVIFSYIHGLGLFFQLYNRNIVLWTVFAIGYLNLFASGYFLILLLYKKKILIK